MEARKKFLRGHTAKVHQKVRMQAVAAHSLFACFQGVQGGCNLDAPSKIGPFVGIRDILVNLEDDQLLLKAFVDPSLLTRWRARMSGNACGYQGQRHTVPNNVARFSGTDPMFPHDCGTDKRVVREPRCRENSYCMPLRWQRTLTCRAPSGLTHCLCWRARCL